MFIPTDISKDGMLKGPSTDIYKDILKSFKGVFFNCFKVEYQALKTWKNLKEVGCEGAILGKAI